MTSRAVEALEQPVVAVAVAACLARATGPDADRQAARDLCNFAALSTDRRFRDALSPWLQGFRIVLGVLDATHAAESNALEDHEQLRVLYSIYGDDHYTYGNTLRNLVDARAQRVRHALERLCDLVDQGVGTLASGEQCGRRRMVRRGLIQLSRLAGLGTAWRDVQVRCRVRRSAARLRGLGGC